MKKLALAAFASIFLAIGTGNASSAEHWPILEHVEGPDPLQAALESGGDPGVAHSVYWAVKVWPKQYRKLRVCFFGGTGEARSLIAEYAMDWMRPEHAMVFDFGEPGKQRTCDPNDKVESQIRIGFDDNKQMQTAGGVDAVVRYPQNAPSMNLANFGNVTRETWLDAYHTQNIRHEFGHVFALMHEHQGPNSPCEEEFDWEKIYAMANGNKEMIDNALRRLPGDQFVAGPFDVKSIMMYQFPAAFFKNGDKAKCYPPELLLKVSDGDIEQMAKLYPVDEASRARRSEKMRAEFERLWAKADPKAKRAVQFDPIRTYFEHSPN